MHQQRVLCMHALDIQHLYRQRTHSYTHTHTHTHTSAPTSSILYSDSMCSVLSRPPPLNTYTHTHTHTHTSTPTSSILCTSSTCSACAPAPSSPISCCATSCSCLVDSVMVEMPACTCEAQESLPWLPPLPQLRCGLRAGRGPWPGSCGPAFFSSPVCACVCMCVSARTRVSTPRVCVCVRV